MRRVQEFVREHRVTGDSCAEVRDDVDALVEQLSVVPTGDELEGSLVTWQFEQSEQALTEAQHLADEERYQEAPDRTEQLVTRLSGARSQAEAFRTGHEDDIAAFERRVRETRIAWVETETQSPLDRGVELADKGHYAEAVECADQALEIVRTALDSVDEERATALRELDTRASERRADCDRQRIVPKARTALEPGADAAADRQHESAVEQAGEATSILRDALDR